MLPFFQFLGGCQDSGSKSNLKMSDLAMVLKLIKGPKQTINEYDYENDNNNDNDYQKWIKPQAV